MVEPSVLWLFFLFFFSLYGVFNGISNCDIKSNHGSGECWQVSYCIFEQKVLILLLSLNKGVCCLNVVEDLTAQSTGTEHLSRKLSVIEYYNSNIVQWLHELLNVFRLKPSLLCQVASPPALGSLSFTSQGTKEQRGSRGEMNLSFLLSIWPTIISIIKSSGLKCLPLIETQQTRTCTAHTLCNPHWIRTWI